MFSFGKSKRVANIVIDDYVIRIVENNGKDLSSIKITAEKPLPTEIIQNGKIIDEIAFFEFMKECVEEWGIKKRHVRFHVPHDLIMMRDITIPGQVEKDELKQYITMEIGNTIHFPFKNPVFDVYDIPESDEFDQVTVLAAPEEEIIKYIEIFDDAKLTPVAVDVQPLGIYRYFLSNHGQPQENKVYLFLELNLTSTNISIFHDHRMEFLRYQPLNVQMSDWQPSEEEQNIRWNFTGDETRLHSEMDNQLDEIYRLMNFYRFSIHNGEKAVTDIVLLGDYPNLQDIKRRLQDRYELPVTMLNTEQTGTDMSSVFIPALGLALKGGK